MITKVRRIKNIGKFYDYASSGVGLDWHRNTFFIAPNAYGKSTLVNICRSMREGDPKLILGRKTLGSTDHSGVVITVDGTNHVFDGTKWDKTCPCISIFDAPFIHENILSYEIEHSHRKNIHRIIIGARGVELAENLANLKEREKEGQKRVNLLERQFASVGFKHHSINEFLAIPPSEAASVQGRIEKIEQEIKSKESESKVRSLGFPRDVSAPVYDLTAAKALAILKLADFHDAAEKCMVAHIKRNFRSKENAVLFIRMGLDSIQADCPFCGQSLESAEPLLQAYRKYFDDTFRTHQQNLSHQTASLAQWNLDNDLTSIISTHNANTGILRQWEPYIDLGTLPDISESVESVRTNLRRLKTTVQAELEKKQKDPNSVADLSQFAALEKEISDLKINVDTYNNSVVAITGKARTYIEDLPRSDADALRNALEKEHEIKRRCLPEWIEWAATYPEAKKEVETYLKLKTDKEKELEDYTKTIFEKYQKRINELLETLGANFTITDLSGKIDDRAKEAYSDFGFLILNCRVPLTARQDDAPCFRNTLSEGDKSTLAFAFFIAAIEKVPELDKQIVLFDDPLSSLDESRREATARILLELSPKLNQLCVLTHKKDFLFMLCDKIHDNTVLQVRSDRKNGSRLEAFDVEEARKSDYGRIVGDMERYIGEDFGPTPDIMQGNIRNVFETVLKTKYCIALEVDIKEKKGFAKLLETLFGKGLLDVTLKPKLFNLCNVANGAHHGEIVDVPSKKLTRDELIPLIKETFFLVEKV